ncbi:ATP-binding protein [Myxococcota bacterium]|nr:ATP-binding protein [Myxococcota bacterium]
MLLGFGAKNFFCFKEWFEVSLEFNGKVPFDVTKGETVAKTSCFIGANAAGKTNALKILSFLSYFYSDSFSSLKPGAPIPFHRYFSNPEPAEFFVDFRIDGIEYTLELVADEAHVITEKLYRKLQRKVVVLQREGDSIVKDTFTKGLDFPLRDNCSFLSTAYHHEVEKLEPIHEFFQLVKSNVVFSGLGDFQAPETVAEAYNSERDALEFAQYWLQRFDTGIVDLEISLHTDPKGDHFYFPRFVHQTADGTHIVPWHFESNGTKQLFKILYFFHRTLQQGGVLCLDEFDMNLHPEILPWLVELFTSPDSNPHGAQFIFSTHNMSILDVMGKFRTFIVNKEDNEAYCYRLDELSPSMVRVDRPILPLYKAHRLGGYPRI